MYSFQFGFIYFILVQRYKIFVDHTHLRTHGIWLDYLWCIWMWNIIHITHHCMYYKHVHYSVFRYCFWYNRWIHFQHTIYIILCSCAVDQQYANIIVSTTQSIIHGFCIQAQHGLLDMSCLFFFLLLLIGVMRVVVLCFFCVCATWLLVCYCCFFVCCCVVGLLRFCV